MSELLSDIWSAVPPSATLVFSAVVAWTAVLNNRLNKQLVEAETTPAMSAYLEPHPRAFRMFELVIKNVGRSPAYNVSVQVEANADSTNTVIGNLNDIGIVSTGLPFFPPDQEIRYLLGKYEELSALKMNLRFRYYRASGTRESTAIIALFPLDVRPYAGVHRIGQTPEQISAQSLQAIAKTLNGMTTAFKPIQVRTRREYLFSSTLDSWRVRWFGDSVLNSEYSPFGYFVQQLRTTIFQWFSLCSTSRSSQPREEVEDCKEELDVSR